MHIGVVLNNKKSYCKNQMYNRFSIKFLQFLLKKIINSFNSFRKIFLSRVLQSCQSIVKYAGNVKEE